MVLVIGLWKLVVSVLPFAVSTDDQTEANVQTTLVASGQGVGLLRCIDMISGEQLRELYSLGFDIRSLIGPTALGIFDNETSIDKMLELDYVRSLEILEDVEDYCEL